MRKAVIALVLILVGCGGSAEPQAAAQPTVIPQPTTAPTSTPAPTVVDLATIDLEPLLVQSGDLPPGYSGSQVRDIAPSMFDNAPPPVQAIDQRFEYEGTSGGGVVVLLYRDQADIDAAYADTVEGMSSPAQQSDIGERADMSIVHNLNVIKFTEGVFTRCAAMVHVRFVGIMDAPSASSYMRRLDKRLQSVICQGEK